MKLFSVLMVCLGFVALGNFQKMIKNGVTCDERKIIVDQHNEYRMMVANGTLSGQPEASNMEKIVWDDALEEIAQKWANGMQFKHNPNRKDDRFSVGENIYMSYTQVGTADMDWKAAVDSWFNEHQSYTYRPVSSDPKTGHYTQLVWAKSTHVGCGATFYEDSGMHYKLYVCDYGPAGNYYGENVYEIGEGCEKLCCTSNQCDQLYGTKC